MAVQEQEAFPAFKKTDTALQNALMSLEEGFSDFAEVLSGGL